MYVQYYGYSSYDDIPSYDGILSNDGYPSFNIAEHCTTLISHKNTNTQIQHMTMCQKDPTYVIFLKRGLFKDMKNYIPVCQTHKYKKYTYTKTQIQHMTKCQKVPTGGIFLKRGLFKDKNIDIPVCQTHKY